MPHPFPHRYHVQLKMTGAKLGELISGPRPVLKGGSPPEFDGSPESWSPEHMFCGSINLCLMLTFLAIARKSKLDVKGYESHAEGVLDRTPDGLKFTSVDVMARIEVAAEEKEKAEAIAGKTEKNCLISLSVACPVHYVATVHQA